MQIKIKILRERHCITIAQSLACSYHIKSAVRIMLSAIRYDSRRGPCTSWLIIKAKMK